MTLRRDDVSNCERRLTRHVSRRPHARKTANVPKNTPYVTHTPKRAAHKIEQDLDSPSHGKTGLKPEEPITVGSKRLPDSPFPKVSPIPYHRPGTPYRKVDPPGTEIVPETLGAGI